MPTLDYDMVVVGAGPAGTTTARVVAEAGFKVVVLEEHPQVGCPVHCSGLVTPRTLDAAGVGDGLVVNKIAGATVRRTSGERLELGGDRVRALVLDRAQLDQALASRAQEAGAELWVESRLRDIQRANGHLDLAISRGPAHRTAHIRTRLLVGADGWHSMVARWMGRGNGRAIATMSMDAEAQGHPEQVVQVLVGRDVAPGWFGWSIPLGGNRVRLGVGCDPEMTPLKPRHFFQRMRDSFPDLFQGLRPLSYSGGYIPLYHHNGSVPTYGDHVLLVGDAARQVKPTSGGGIYTSIVAGGHAGRAARAALQAEDCSARALSGYEKAWRGDLAQEFERGLEVRQMYTGMSDAQMDALLRLLKHRALLRLINRYGDIDFPSTMFARLALASPTIRGMVALSHVLPVHWLGALGQGVRWLMGSRSA